MDTKTIHEAHAGAPKQPEAQATPIAPKKKPPRKLVAPGRQTGSETARRSAATILEVLGGERRPSEAAEALGISIMRYYVMESRALQGMLDGCEARPRGVRANPERRVAQLERQIDTLQRDAARYQALARAANRTIGIAPVKSTERTKKGTRKRRTPTVRALKAAAGFRAPMNSTPGAEAAPKPAAQLKGVS